VDLDSHLLSAFFAGSPQFEEEGLCLLPSTHCDANGADRSGLVMLGRQSPVVRGRSGGRMDSPAGCGVEGGSGGGPDPECVESKEKSPGNVLTEMCSFHDRDFFSQQARGTRACHWGRSAGKDAG